MSAMTGWMPNVNLEDDIEKADIVVAGTIVHVSPESGAVALVSAHANPEDDQLHKAEFSIIRHITGMPVQGPLVVFFLRGRSPSRPWLELNPDETVLLFLTRVRGGYLPLATMDPPIWALPSLRGPPVRACRADAVAPQ